MEQTNISTEMQEIIDIFRGLQGGIISLEDYHRPRTTEEWERAKQASWESSARNW